MKTNDSECATRKIPFEKGEAQTSSTTEKLASEIRDLPDAEKLRLVDAILTDLDKPDPEIDRIWAEEARRRWAAYKADSVSTVSYEDLKAKYDERR